jgi:hypothetical protein
MMDVLYYLLFLLIPKSCSQKTLASADLARLVIRRVPPMLDLRPTCTLLTRCSFSTRLPTGYVRVSLNSEAHGWHNTVKKCSGLHH